MPRIRWIVFAGAEWRLSDLARLHHLRPQTLASRIDRGLSIERALTTGLCSRTAAGQSTQPARGAILGMQQHRLGGNNEEAISSFGLDHLRD